MVGRGWRKPYNVSSLQIVLTNLLGAFGLHEGDDHAFSDVSETLFQVWHVFCQVGIGDG